MENLKELLKTQPSERALARLLAAETEYNLCPSTVNRVLKGEAKPLAIALLDYAAKQILIKQNQHQDY